MHSKNVLRALGLSLMAALGLMAFTAVGAQAANLSPPFTHAKIKILGSELNATGITGKAETSGKLFVPALSVEITCPKFTVVEGTISSSEGHGVAKVLFEECKVFSVNKETGELTSAKALPCEPLDSGSGKAGHILADALVLIVLHEKKVYLIFEQLNLEAAVPLSTIKYTSGTGCPIPLKQEVFGRVVFDINSGDLNTGAEVKEPLITGGSKVTQELFTSQLLYGVNPAFISGSATLALGGIHTGCTWGVI